MKILKSLLILFLASAALWGANDRDYEKKYITVTPGKQYKAGWLHKLFLGAHWRGLWTTPVTGEVLDLDRFAGGLTPVKQGGGKQTKSLRFKGNDGNIWKFRSVDKDPKKLLLKELQDTLVESALQDQVSSANPMAPLVVAPILNAVGILQAEPRLVWMPDDEKLGKFREEFGGMLGMIEIHPGVGKEDSPGFEGAEDIIGTFKLFKRLENKRNEKVDAGEFLKARLVDIFLGDWDRHPDQWRWGMYKEGKQKLWEPIPRDRDQAFSRCDGLVPRICSYVVMDLVSFGSRYPRVKKITWSGRFLDRRFLSGLDKTTWDSITEFVKNRLTDRVIEEAVKRLPPEHYKKAGKKMINTLKSRRDRLPKISHKYYKNLNKVIDVYTGDRDDFVEINRISNDKTGVTVFIRDKKSGKKKGKPLYHKTVDNRLTAEIRIYLSGGDDRVEVKGIVDSSPLVRVIGGEGKDELIDHSIVKGFFLKITPFGKVETRTIFYDSGKKTVFKKGPGTKVVREKVPKPANQLEKYTPLQKNRGREFYGVPLFSFNSEDGMVFGGAAMLYKFNFRVKPYDYWLSLNASYATKTKSSHFHFQGIFNSIIKGTALHLDILKTQLLFNNYYGFGNNTGLDREQEKEKYYRTEEKFIFFHPSLHFNLGKNTKAVMGLVYAASEIALENESLLDGFPLNRYGLGNFKSFELASSLQFDTRDKAANPHKGVFLKLDCSYTPKLFDSRYNFVKSGIDARFFLPLKAVTDMTVALRLGGTKIWGDYPFFNSVFLGGGSDLRGYSKKRFSGDAALFGQLEFRAYLGRVKLILPGRLGFHLFGEAGRVFGAGESSRKWHPGYGGGIWIAFVNRMVNTSFTVAKSPEKFVIYFALRLMY